MGAAARSDRATTIAFVPRDWREGRRWRAWELKPQGWTQRLIAAALGVTPGAVSPWLTRVREGGVQGLRRRIAPGRVPKLTAEQLADLPALLAQGTAAWGFQEEVWTTRRLAAVLEPAFGVRSPPAHVSRLLRAIGWSPQQPVARATQRDEAAIAAWDAHRWATLHRGPHAPASRSSGETRLAAPCGRRACAAPLRVARRPSRGCP